MSIEIEMAFERAKQMRQDAAQYRLARQARAATPRRGRWARFFGASRWGGSHRRDGQLM